MIRSKVRKLLASSREREVARTVAGVTDDASYDLYAEVRVRRSWATLRARIAGRTGVILGVATPERQGQPYSYAVDVSGRRHTYVVVHRAEMADRVGRLLLAFRARGYDYAAAADYEHLLPGEGRTRPIVRTPILLSKPFRRWEERWLGKGPFA